MPFAPITGVNNQYHSILFGFALLCNEQEDTFEWVFREWLAAMHGKAPLTIITDQDIAMGNAIARVMPTTKHHLCTWHISQKYPTKFGSLLQSGSNFKTDFEHCVKKSLTIPEFEERWNYVIQTYSLETNTFVNDLYTVKEKWVPAYTNRDFSAGMRTTSRSEGMNSYFDNFVNTSTGLKDFIEQSEVALNKQLGREKKEDFCTKYYERRLLFRTSLEIHASTLYTRTIFKKFQDEYRKGMLFKVTKLKDSYTADFKVFSCVNTFKYSRDRLPYFIHYYKGIDTYSCTCMKFESSGMICRHLLRCLEVRNKEQIPTTLISTRWLNDNNVSEVEVAVETTKTDSYIESEDMRYIHLVDGYKKLALEQSKTRKGYLYGIEAQVRDMKISREFPPECEYEDEDEIEGKDVVPPENEEDDIVQEPLVATTKGRKKEDRIKSSIEKAMTMKPLRKCKLCNVLTNHDSRNHYKALGLQSPPKN